MPEAIHRVFLIPFLDQDNPKLLHENPDPKEAQAQAEEIASNRAEEGLVGVVAPDGAWTFQPVRFSVDGLLLPPTSPQTLTVRDWPAEGKLLHSPAREIQDPAHERWGKLASLMLLTMYERRGVGLAAPQIGLPVSLVVFDPVWPSEGRLEPRVLVNPQVEADEDEAKVQVPEGCLSLAGVLVEIPRYSEVLVRGTDLAGEERAWVATGFEAQVIQHEVDHLRGVLFLDHLSKVRRKLYYGKVRRAHRRAKKQARRLVQEASERQRFEREVEEARGRREARAEEVHR